MTSTSLPTRRNRWRSAAAGVAIAAASFTMTACGDDEAADETGILEEGDLMEEDEDPDE
ncbi:hypothetical protein GCM10023328_27760 [Modestobacter marinus]|uniref:Uncharacterized protein n=1 Tax=Modestobacter marinus TaxID=477641 RepID=A0A846LU72_9ACTN|nr:hypothetical protein [Modestobacter marinus]NIH69892.1 hypothetical protein [Modestobacter marinus]GGL80758.1 hypothetical protein GCM10011589_41320 [Modestobacter marinus]